MSDVRHITDNIEYFLKKYKYIYKDIYYNIPCVYAVVRDGDWQYLTKKIIYILKIKYNIFLIKKRNIVTKNYEWRLYKIDRRIKNGNETNSV